MKKENEKLQYNHCNKLCVEGNIVSLQILCILSWSFAVRNYHVLLRLSTFFKVLSFYQGSEDTHMPCPAPHHGSLTLPRDPISVRQVHQSLRQRHHSRAGQLAVGPAEPDPLLNPHSGPASAHPHPQGGGRCPGLGLPRLACPAPGWRAETGASPCLATRLECSCSSQRPEPSSPDTSRHTHNEKQFSTLLVTLISLKG